MPRSALVLRDVPGPWPKPHRGRGRQAGIAMIPTSGGPAFVDKVTLVNADSIPALPDMCSDAEPHQSRAAGGEFPSRTRSPNEIASPTVRGSSRSSSGTG
jgi:hypothetical protein